MKAKDELGHRGEDHAADYLMHRGMRVVERNWRCPLGEIDIVAYDGPVLVVVEVKTRSSAAYGHPVEAVTPAKLRRLQLLAAEWVAQREIGLRRTVRIDVVGIIWPTYGEPAVQHLQAVS